LGLPTSIQPFPGHSQLLHKATNKATGRAVKIEWSQEYELTFDQIKNRLGSAPVLLPPNMDKSFILWTDASEQEFRAVLQQQAEDSE